MNVLNDYDYYGTKHSGSVSCWSVDTGMYMALKEQPTVEWVACGHDHYMDTYGDYEGIFLSFGRKTGYGSYSGDRKVLPRGLEHFAFSETLCGIVHI